MRSDIVTIIKDYAEANGFLFYYGTKGYQNIHSIDTGLKNKTVVYLSQIEETGQTQDHFWNMKNQYSFAIFIGQLSDLDEDYQTEKYFTRLTNLEIKANEMCGLMYCNRFRLQSFKSIDDINVFDANIDGITLDCVIELRNDN